VKNQRYTLAIRCVTAAISLLIASSLGQSEDAKPDWSINLTTVATYREYMQGSSPIEHAQIVFIADNKIAVSFLARRPSGDGLRLVCIIIDGKSRTFEKSLVWSTPYKDYNNTSTWLHRWVTPTNHGEFLVFTGSKLIRYNASLEALQERAVTDPLKTTFKLSPMRSLLLVSDFVRTGKFRQTIAQTSDLNNERTFGETPTSVAVADDGAILLLMAKGTKIVSGCRTPLADPDSPSRKTECGSYSLPNGQDAYLCTSASSCSIVSPASPMPTFINSKTIFDPSTFNNFALRDRTGKIIYKATYSDVVKEQGGTPISRDALSQRFSFGSTYAVVSPPPVAQITTTERVHVFDLAAMKPVLTLIFRTKGDHPFRSFGHAISPDGIRLAVLRDSDLDLYRLPDVGQNTESLDLKEPTSGLHNGRRLAALAGSWRQTGRTPFSAGWWGPLSPILGSSGNPTAPSPLTLSR